MLHSTLRVMILSLLLALTGGGLVRTGNAFTLELSDDFPSELRSCFKNGISQLLTTDRNNTKAIRKLFFSHVDPGLLGSRAFGGQTWKNASDGWQKVALEQYFQLVFGTGSASAATINADTAVIKGRLANKPEVRAKNQWHLVVSVEDGEYRVLVAILMTTRCRAFDFAQGPWASSVMDSASVDGQVPSKDRKRK